MNRLHRLLAIDTWLVAHCGLMATLFLELTIFFLVCLLLFIAIDRLLGSWAFVPKKYRTDERAPARDREAA